MPTWKVWVRELYSETLEPTARTDILAQVLFKGGANSLKPEVVLTYTLLPFLKADTAPIWTSVLEFTVT
jgi:hypothetical protein